MTHRSVSVPKYHRVDLDDGRFANGYSYDDLIDLFDRFKDSGCQTLVVHLHGGLVSASDGLETAERLVERYRTHGQAWPVFFIWRSGIVDALKNLLREILNDPFMRFVWARVLERVLRSHPHYAKQSRQSRLTVAQQAVARAWQPDGDGEEPFGDLDTQDWRPKFSEQDEDRFADELEQETAGQDPSIAGLTVSARDRYGLNLGLPWWVRAAKVTFHVLRRFRRRRDHGIWCTVYEELLWEWGRGAPATIWEEMKEACENAFGDELDSHQRPRRGGTAFLRELERVWDDWSGNEKPRIVLVGHSCGMVFACELIKAADSRLDRSIRLDVVSLAAACTMRRFESAVIDHRHRVVGLRAFGLNDATERSDRSMRKAGYTRSLLYLVSGAFERARGGGARRDEPLVGMERYYSGRSPYDDDTSKDVAAFVSDRIWGPTTGQTPGRMTDAEEHGQFDDYDDHKSTIDSVTHILAKGFGERPSSVRDRKKRPSSRTAVRR